MNSALESEYIYMKLVFDSISFSMELETDIAMLL